MFFDKLDRIIIPKWSEIKENWNRKHHPISYTTEKYVNSLDLENPEKKQNWTEVSKNLSILSVAEKNYTQNKPMPSYIRKAIGIFGTIASIFCITNAEKFDCFPTKAWPFAFKEKDND